MTVHARERARDRFGVSLTWAEFDALVAEVRREPFLVRVEADGCGAYLVRTKGVAMLAVMPPDMGAILTFLPLRVRGFDFGRQVKPKPASRRRPLTVREAGHRWRHRVSEGRRPEVEEDWRAEGVEVG